MTTPASIRRRRVIDYVAATRNEIAIDEGLLRLAGFDPARTGHIPRAPKWSGLAARWPRLVRLVAWLARLLWTRGGGAALMLLEFLPRWLRSRRDKAGTIVPESSGYVLALSSRVGDVLDTTLIPDLPDTWITMPWAPLRRAPANARLVDVFCLLSPGDLVDALRDSIAAVRRVSRGRSTAKWALQGYTAFKWFAVRTAVDKLVGDLFMAEHFDRWAVLVDRSAGSRLPGAGPRTRRLTLVQHGSVSGLDGRGESAYGLPALPARLQCVTRLYVYGPDEEAIFRQFVLGGADSRNEVEVIYFKPHIELRPVEAVAAATLLFVGHPLCEAAQVALYRILRDRIAIDAYYKPHPLAPMSPSLTTVGWRIVSEADHFPGVDLLVSYPSTLVVEYSALGIPAVVHSLNANPSDSESIVRDILAQVETLAVRASV